MRTATLLKNNLTYFWRTNLAVVAGVAIAVSVLAGALVVGDSVRASLRELFLSRLGATDHVITSTAFFRERLADDLLANDEFHGAFDAACPLILFEGVVSHDGRRGSGVQVYGVDERFWKFHGREGRVEPLEGSNVFVSGGLVEEVGGEVGDTLLLTIEKPSAIHAESLHGRKDDLGRTIRLTIREVLSPSDLGDFSIRPQQGAARTIFVPLRRLQRDLEQPARVNAVLVSGKETGSDKALEKVLRETFALEDLAVKIRPITGSGRSRFRERHGDHLRRACRQRASDRGGIRYDFVGRLNLSREHDPLGPKRDSILCSDRDQSREISCVSPIGARRFAIAAADIKRLGRKRPRRAGGRRGRA